MKLKKKYIVLLIIIGVLLILFITIFIKYKQTLNKYTKINKKYESAFVTLNKKDVNKTSTIEIDAKIVEGEIIDTTTKKKYISGDIIIDSKKYELKGVNSGKATNNVFWGQIKDSSIPKYTFLISNDFNSIFLDSPQESVSIVSPAKTIEEFINIKNILLGNE